MKTKDEALAEWVADEIRFADVHDSGKSVFTREEFAAHCERLRGKRAMTVPLLHDSFENLKRKARCAGMTPDDVERWLDGIFQPETMVRFTDVYEVKNKIDRKAASARAALEKKLAAR